MRHNDDLKTLVEAVVAFREYERHHSDKGDKAVTAMEARDAYRKATRNRLLARRLEGLIGRAVSHEVKH